MVKMLHQKQVMMMVVMAANHRGSVHP